ncbi:MAG: ribbon-helix-helix domain-containing protein [candidate division NC10 bacterium]|nr:ribbon-helix-helix domain-containing protein [candidate division NC10 bacterium]
MVFNMDYEQAEKLDRLAEVLGTPKSALVREAVDQLLEKYRRELAEAMPEGAGRPPRREEPGRGRR